jgi:hypothetical protein
MKLLARETATALGQTIDEETEKAASYEFGLTTLRTLAKSVVPD